ncbi:MAG: LysR family transcriptional regulator [Rubrivivax sp.]
MRYDLVDLKLFVAVADAGNVSRGAAAAFLAPSSASLRIKQLEDALGARLFTRHARGVVLTRAGQVMLEHCRRCLAELEQMHADLAPHARGVKSQLTLFANSTAIASYLPDDLAGYFRRFPGVRVVLEERLSHDIVAAVAEGRADIGIVTGTGDHPQLVFTPYREDELVVLAPRAVKLGRGGKVGFEECLKHPFISLRSGAAIHTFLVGRAAALGEHLDVRVQVAGFSAVIDLVRSGAGLAIVPRSVLREPQREGVAVLRLAEPWAERRLSVCARRDASLLSAHARALLELLTAPR